MSSKSDPALVVFTGTEHEAASNTVAASQWPEGMLLLAPCSPHQLAQLIGSYGKPAEMPFPRTRPVTQQP